MILWILRGAFFVLMFGVAMVVLVRYINVSAARWGAAYALIIVIVALSAIAADLYFRDKQITTISAIYMGLLLGLLLGSIFSIALEPFFSYWLGEPTTHGSAGYAML